jgi:hypothetical protein
MWRNTRLLIGYGGSISILIDQVHNIGSDMRAAMSS